MSEKVLIHLSDRNGWRHVLAQAAGMVEEDRGARVVIVADQFAGAFCASCGPDLVEKMEDAASLGIVILVCEASLNTLNIKKEKLPKVLKTVPAAYPEIISKKKQGFVYICAG